MPKFKRYIGIDYSGAQTPTASLKGLRRQAGELKEVVAELILENRLLKKSMTGDGGDEG